MGKKIVVLYFGDLDPSGDFMSEDVENRFTEFGIDLSIERICLNDEHIDRYKLPRKFEVLARKGERIYDKLEADPRHKRFERKHGQLLFQVELEALDPGILTDLLRKSILRYVDLGQHKRVVREEKREVEEIGKRLGLQ
jgi:hypothetical protein